MVIEYCNDAILNFIAFYSNYFTLNLFFMKKMISVLSFASIFMMLSCTNNSDEKTSTKEAAKEAKKPAVIEVPAPPPPPQPPKIVIELPTPPAPPPPLPRPKKRKG